MQRFGVILLAAGNASRMGCAKQLLEYGGKALLRHAAEVALGAGGDSVIVVLGSNASELRPVLTGPPLTIVENFRWAEGMGTSIRAGIEEAVRQNLDGAILGLADQPLVTSETLSRLFDAHAQTRKPIVASSYAGTVGVPVFFANEFFPALLALKPDQGCKGLILANAARAVHLACPEAELDVDTPQDYQRLTSAALAAR
jgi:molybdenum cofactor cytidylyltransferase